MSNWTHVAGIVRIDMYDIENPETEEQIREVFGKTLHYTDSGELWDEAFAHRDRFLPCGSEGSLDMTVWINPNRNYLNRATVSIFGDLRDHDDPDAIIAWFKDKCSKFWIRNASIVVDNEWNGVRTWHSCGEEDEDAGEDAV